VVIIMKEKSFKRRGGTILSVMITTMLAVTAFAVVLSDADGSEGDSLFSGSGTIVSVECGMDYSVALKSDGTVWAWGANSYGQLGDGTTIDKSTPVQASGLTDIIAIVAGSFHTVALKSDGTVWAWGFNGCGQLGDGTTMDKSTPVQVSGLTDIDDIAAGREYTVALRGGTVWAWGYNGFGQLGDGTETNRTSPVQVSGLTGVSAIAAGNNHTVVLKDSKVWAWGYNGFGQLGDGTETNRTSPVQVSGLTDIDDIAAGNNHTIALKSGAVWAWGYNEFGQLGNGTTIDKSTPVQVSGLAGVSAISAGGDLVIVLKSNGTVWAWGYNQNGQLGDGTTTNNSTPSQVIGLTGVSAVVTGGYHAVALKSDGTVWVWGSGKAIPTQVASPVSISAIGGVTPPSAGKTPVSKATETQQDTAAVSWSPSHATFKSGISYTATITLTAKAGYTLSGVSADFFTVAGATTVSNSANSGVVIAVFKVTGSDATISIAAIGGVTPPAAGKTPVSTATETAQYTATVSWSPTHSTFGNGTSYTATITLTAKAGYTLTGVSADFFTVSGATTVSNSANSGVVTAVFPAAAEPLTADGGGNTMLYAVIAVMVIAAIGSAVYWFFLRKP
jgi:YD repeat-containing protein